jgi:hypothetical protein
MATTVPTFGESYNLDWLSQPGINDSSRGLMGAKLQQDEDGKWWIYELDSNDRYTQKRELPTYTAPLATDNFFPDRGMQAIEWEGNEPKIVNKQAPTAEGEPMGWNREMWGDYRTFRDKTKDYLTDPTKIPKYTDFTGKWNDSYAESEARKGQDGIWQTMGRPWNEDAESRAAKASIDQEYLAAVADYNQRYGANIQPEANMLGPENGNTTLQTQNYDKNRYKMQMGLTDEWPKMLAGIGAVLGAGALGGAFSGAAGAGSSGITSSLSPLYEAGTAVSAGGEAAAGGWGTLAGAGDAIEALAIGSELTGAGTATGVANAFGFPTAEAWLASINPTWVGSGVASGSLLKDLANLPTGGVPGGGGGSSIPSGIEHDLPVNPDAWGALKDPGMLQKLMDAGVPWDVVSKLGGAGSALGGLLGQGGLGDLIGSGLDIWAKNNQFDKLDDLQHKYFAEGEPYRSKLKDLYADPSGFLSSPEVTVPVDQGTNAVARALSAKSGNPTGSGTALQELQNYSSNALFGRLGEEKNRLGVLGGLDVFNRAAPGAATDAIAAQQGMFNTGSSALSNLFNPVQSGQTQLQDWMKTAGTAGTGMKSLFDFLGSW